MSLLNETFTLKNQIKIPKIGLGTWQSSPEDAYHATKFALENGYRHVDTAAAYKTKRLWAKPSEILVFLEKRYSLRQKFLLN